MKKSYKKILSIIVYAVSFFVLTACTSSKSEKLSYPMGVILPLSGSNSRAANDVLDGMKLAQEQINLQGGVGGIPLNLIVADNAYKDYEFADTFNSMTSKGVKVFNFGFGKEIIFLRRHLMDDNAIFINYICSYAPVTLDSSNSTRIFINAAQQGDIMATAVNREDGKERQIVLVNVDNLAGKSNGDYLGFNLKVDKTKLYKDVYGEGETRFGIFAEQIMRLWSEYVFYVGYGKELPSFMTHLGKVGYKGMVVADCGFYNEPVKIPEGVKYLRVETLFQQGKIDTKYSKDFVASYEKKYGKKPTWLAAYGYDGVMLLSRAAVSAKYNPAAMRAFFTDKSYDGAIGKISFDKTADATSQLEFVEQK